MPFEVLRTAVLPEFLESRVSSRQLRVLSAVCSSGQEPYSIALTLAKNFPALSEWDVQITALDPSQELVETARLGAYEQIVVQRGLPAMLLIKYFERSGHLWAIKDPPKSWVNFECFDITSQPLEEGSFDVVFLANVLSKVDVDSHAQILEQLAGAMAPDGYLFLGTSEAELMTSPLFEKIDDSRAPFFRLHS
jgi:chemotaxis protein methyltransferase CheR